MKIYVGHPITGLDGDEVFQYYDNIKGQLLGHTILCPMTGKDHLRTAKDLGVDLEEHPITKNHAIFQRDTWMVSQCDLVLMDLTGATKASIGCCMELAIASWLNKHTIVVMDKFNVHNHAFTKEAADIVFETLDDALDYINLLKF